MKFIIISKDNGWMVCSQQTQKDAVEIPIRYTSENLVLEVADELNKKYNTRYKAKLPMEKNEQ